MIYALAILGLIIANVAAAPATIEEVKAAEQPEHGREMFLYI